MHRHTRTLCALLLAATLPSQQRTQGSPSVPAETSSKATVELDVSISSSQRAFVDRPEVLLIDSQTELDAFQRRARQLSEGHPQRANQRELVPMQVDFESVRLVAVCWGRHPSKDRPGMRVRSAQLVGETVRLELRTSLTARMPPVPATQGAASSYPARVIAVPRTERVLVHITGARKRKHGFRAVRGDDLIVSLAPDSMPLRDEVEQLPVEVFDVQGKKEPSVEVERIDGNKRQIVDIAWCLFSQERNRLELDTLEMRGDTLHVGVVATRPTVSIYSGPMTCRPRIRLIAPGSKRVAVHVRRRGRPIGAEDRLVDFQPFVRGRLEVTVEHHRPKRQAWATGGFVRRD